jgi:hypothetical protein
MTKNGLPNKTAVSNRRAQLRRWIDDLFDGSQSAFIASTNDGDRQLNQGELSGLLKEKSFGEKRARTLEALAHMPQHYLDSTVAPSEARQQRAAIASEPRPQYAAVPDRVPSWPFVLVSAERLTQLKRALGPKAGSEAISDMDAQLQIVMEKWERVAAAKKKQKPPVLGSTRSRVDRR